ncbi:hypothetical protein AMTRI_Chr09g38380 [Amborella trichopoda]|uniref:Glutamyl-tRNA(Gln) amidotransferase subunit C, chloroplastic/mitochondrial n=1 Tax=Amborella trichopoda TaxID=13333 RepID=W1NXQ0_AMBTC|nr:glutamyl-tRNA(Gln) amidotransferase subunit C, chloroplastic/mitochondrial [Amborella trichopoda]ERN00428.1 hypothetical protein AMTR_s00100p00082990 [Amborella trichopoda]|eukprot:XP_020519449.1 glutamyl-tRNA(Gln) amidotransferase subunit C, chloroplastic/mitochondrial [Amborella trichopoda]
MASSSFFSFSRIPAYLSRTTLKRRFLSSRCSPFVRPPDVAQLAESARISLTANEIEEFGPKIKQVIDWFGQLQAVNLESIEPALRADTGGSDNTRADEPEIFGNREAMIAAVSSYSEPFIKVPKVLNKE